MKDLYSNIHIKNKMFLLYTNWQKLTGNVQRRPVTLDLAGWVIIAVQAQR